MTITALQGALLPMTMTVWILAGMARWMRERIVPIAQAIWLAIWENYAVIRLALLRLARLMATVMTGMFALQTLAPGRAHALRFARMLPLRIVAVAQAARVVAQVVRPVGAPAGQAS